MLQIERNPDRHTFDMDNGVDRPSELHSQLPRLMAFDARSDSDLLLVYYLCTTESGWPPNWSTTMTVVGFSSSYRRRAEREDEAQQNISMSSTP